MACTTSGRCSLSYVLSFVIIGIYWNNHHHMLRATQRINGTVLWANLHLLFWLSLIPSSPAGWARTTSRRCRLRCTASCC